MSKGIMTAVIVCALVAMGGVYFIITSAPQKAEESTPSKVISLPESAASDTVPAAEKEAVPVAQIKDASTAVEIKTFAVSGRNFSFTPDEIRVKKGDKVKINFTNAGGWPHDFVIDEFNARTTQVSAGESSSAEFVADKTGTFEYYCSVGQHRASGMKGRIMVE